jgi:hypothetical protein
MLEIGVVIGAGRSRAGSVRLWTQYDRRHPTLLSDWEGRSSPVPNLFRAQSLMVFGFNFPLQLLDRVKPKRSLNLSCSARLI